jgi:hypothetical protein
MITLAATAPRLHRIGRRTATTAAPLFAEVDQRCNLGGLPRVWSGHADVRLGACKVCDRVWSAAAVQFHQRHHDGLDDGVDPVSGQGVADGPLVPGQVEG